MITTTLLPPAPRGPGGLPPLVPLALGFGLLSLLALGQAGPNRAAEVIGYRITVTACSKGKCEDLPIRRSFEEGRYACQTTAQNLATLADLKGAKELGLPPGEWTFTGTCPPVLGDRRA